MAGPFKATLFFRSAADEGWTESYYIDAADIETAVTDLDTMEPLRLAMMDDTFALVFARVSDVTVQGDSLPHSSTVVQPGTLVLGEGSRPVEANVALLLLWIHDSQQKGRTFLRGLSTDVVRGRFVDSTEDWDDAYAAWSSWIESNCLIYCINPASPPTKHYTDITDAAILRVTARKPGRPFGLLVGRRRHPV